MTEDWVVRFQSECETKHRRGVQEHRGGDETLPYEGYRPAEYCDEQLDSVNYLYGMLLDGIIGPGEYDEGWKRHFEQWWWMKQVMER